MASLHSHPSSIFYAKALSTATCGLILGSTSWAGFAVMPSIIAAPLSTYAKLSVFEGLIIRANQLLPPVFLSSVSAFAYLTYYYSTLQTSPSLVTARESALRFGIATASLLVATGLQVVIVPKNDRMQEMVKAADADTKTDDGKEANQKIGELLQLNWVRVILSGIAFGISVVELAR